MGLTLSQKIIATHLVEGDMVAGSEIGIRIVRGHGYRSRARGTRH
jgi:hypothetical protein